MYSVRGEGDGRLASFDLVKMERPEDLVDLPKIKRAHDLVIVDAGGRDNELYRVALTYCDCNVIPCLPSVPDTWGVIDTLAVAAEVKSDGFKFKNRILLNGVAERVKMFREALGAVEQIAREGRQAQVLHTHLNQLEDFRQSLMTGRGVLEHRPRGKAAMRVAALYSELTDGE